MLGQKHVSRGQSRPYPKGTGPQRPPQFFFLGPLPIRLNGLTYMKRQNLICSTRGVGACPRRSPKGSPASPPQKKWGGGPPIHACIRYMRNSNKHLHGDQTRCEEIFLHGRPRMPTRDLFAVANLVYNSLGLWQRPKATEE